MGEDSGPHDQMMLHIAQQVRGIEPLMDTFFAFLRRKTDFFVGADEKKVEETVMKAVRKQMSLAERTKAEKKAMYAKADEEAAARRKKKESEQAALNKKLAEKEGALSAGAGGGFDMDEAPAAAAPPPPPPAASSTAKSDAGPAKTEGEDDDDDDKTPAPVGNGGSVTTPGGTFVWTQELAEATIKVPVPPSTKGRDCMVDIQKKSLKVGIRGQAPVIDGPMSETVVLDDSTWTLEDSDSGGGKEIVIQLSKENKMHWWKCVIVGDPEINTQKVQPENSKLGDLDGETRMTVEKMMFDQQQKAMGKPTSEETKKSDMMAQFMKQHPEMDFSNAKFC